MMLPNVQYYEFHGIGLNINVRYWGFTSRRGFTVVAQPQGE